MGCHFLLQGTFPTQGLNLHLLPALQAGSLLLSHQGSLLFWLGAILCSDFGSSNLKLFILSRFSFPNPMSLPLSSFKHFPSNRLSHQEEEVTVAVQSPSCVWLLATSWTAVCQVSLSLTISWSLPKFTSIASVMPFNHLILWHPLLLLPLIFPSLRGFSMSQLFTSDDQYTRVSASPSVLPMSIQGWSPLILTGLTSLLSKRLLGVFSSTTVQKHQLVGALPSLWSSSHNHVCSLGRP